MTFKHPETALQQAGILEGEFESSDNGEALCIREITHATVLRLHTLSPLADIGSDLAECGLEMPAKVNRSTGQDPAVLCIGPQEWLFFSEYLDAERLLNKVRPCVDLSVSALNDNSNGLATLRVSGFASAWLLGKLSCLDFQSGRQHGQHCARTLMAQATVVVHYHQPRNGSSPFVFDLIFDRSYAAYCWQLLLASAPHAVELYRVMDDTSPDG
jgi:heterotetrameric sarcosine oxidase gamma subunit